jgi:hypothetical protein
MLVRLPRALFENDGAGGGGSGEGDTKTPEQLEAEAKLAKEEEDKAKLAKEANPGLPQTLEEALAEITRLKGEGAKVPKWAQDRIDTITKHWRETERERDALRGQVEQLKAAKPSQKLGYTEEDVRVAAAKLAQDQAYAEATGKVLAEGRKTFPNFDASLQQLHTISPFMVQTPQGAVPNMPQGFIEAVIELDKPEEVLNELALPANHDEAARIMALPPSRQGVALARFASAMAPVKEISKTPAPGSLTVSGRARGTPTVYDAGKISKEEWFALRNKELADKAAARRRA